MTGPRDSIIGATVEQTIQRFLTQRSVRLQTPETGDAIFNGVVFDIDARNGACRAVQRVDLLDAAGIDGDAQRRAPS
jgi:calcineurin-like phosphoesterase